MVRWVQTGPQKVLVFLDGAAVHGSPFEVAVQPAALSAAACRVTGLDSSGASSPSKTRGGFMAFSPLHCHMATLRKSS